jgi:hypothetical protein
MKDYLKKNPTVANEVEKLIREKINAGASNIEPVNSDDEFDEPFDLD